MVNMDRINIVPTIDTQSNVMVIIDPKEETLQRYIEAGYTVISRGDNFVKLLKTKMNDIK